MKPIKSKSHFHKGGW